MFWPAPVSVPVVPIVSFAQIAPEEEATRARAGAGVRRVAALRNVRPRNGIVIKPINIPQPGRNIGRGFPIRRIEGPVFRWMLVDVHCHVQRLLNTGRGRVHFDDQPVRRQAEITNPLSGANSSTAS